MGENLEGKITWSINIIDWKLNGPKNKLGSTIIYWTDMENIFIVKILWLTEAPLEVEGCVKRIKIKKNIHLWIKLFN